jgi:flavin-dependent dehydrogenase
VSRETHDVVVIGGGPAGACVATLVAEKGHDVVLLERSSEPRFKVGESLIPATYWSLERLGVLDRMVESPFTKKYSVQFFTGEGRATAPFFFRETDPGESSQTWQVLRSEFDSMLLDNAAEKGVDVRRGVTVREILLDGERATGVRVARNGGPSENLGARVVVDASGQSALLARKLGLRLYDDRLRNAACFTHFRGARRDEGEAEGATLILHTRDKESWFWFIPLHDDITSVGVVGSMDYLVRRREGAPQEIFDQELALCPALAERLEGAEQTREVQFVRDFTYRSSRFAGDAWIIVGDAFGFVDPIYSSGVFLALKSGEFAADSILEALEYDDVSAERLGRNGQTYLDGMETFRKLVYAFYDREFSFAAFLRDYPDCREAVVDLLVGNVYSESIETLFEPLGQYCELPTGQPKLLL